MLFHFTFQRAREDQSERELPVMPSFRADPAEGERPPRILLDTGPSRAGGHQMELFETCPRMFRIMEDMAREGAKTKGSRFFLNRGSLVHIGLAHYHAIRAINEQGKVRAGDVHISNPAQLYPPVEAVHVGADVHPEWRGSLREAEALVERYIEWADTNPNPWEIIGVEVEVGIQLAPGEVYTARLDLLVRHRALTTIFAVDHKTAYYPQDAPKLYGHSWQMLGVQEIGRELWGPKWGGIVLNVIASAPKAKVPVVRLPPAPAPALAERFRAHAIARRREMREVQGAPVSAAPMRLCSCRRPREGPCPVYSACAVIS